MNWASTDPKALTEALHKAIPAFAAMQGEITYIDDDTVRMTAPLAPNKNVHGSGFAGSSMSLPSVAGWVIAQRMAFNLYGERGITVLRSCSGDFSAPVNGQFEIEASLVNQEARRNGIAIEVQGSVKHGGHLCSSVSMLFRVLEQTLAEPV
ncbi:MAG: YiiD C-terminal domain-containing protein [Gammaproteobacteria bacterium]|nr:YiiD C-terminal domain-containing protein [Gammaproteobacteria bacterium]